MHPKTEQAPRRVHDAQFKAKVLAQCREPGVSVASVALANGLNANLIRKWQVGRGLKRSGLPVERSPSGPTMPTTARVPSATTSLQFMPVNLAAAGCGADTVAANTAPIRIELRCASASLTVQWPPSQSRACSVWLSELANAVLKR